MTIVAITLSALGVACSVVAWSALAVASIRDKHGDDVR